jgi:hypothetical protein
MTKVTFIEIDSLEGTKQYAIIDRGNEEFTSMTKEEFDKRQAEQSTSIVTGDE